MTEIITLQRIRNRIMEHLELAASFEDQVQYQQAAPHINVPNEIINQWEDWVPSGWRQHFKEPVFSLEEINAIGRFNSILNAVIEATPDQLPSLSVLLDTTEWQRLATASAEILVVFQVRGRTPEESDGT